MDKLIAGKKFTANAVLGIFPAESRGDDVIVYKDETRSETLQTFHFLRQQRQMGQGIPNICLADFVAQKNDYMGLFAVTAGLGIDELAKEYEKDHDDYHSIMVKAIGDRFAEAFAEYVLSIQKK